MNESIKNIENKIERVIVKWNMLENGCRVVVGLSGGADSLTLTHFLLKYTKEHNFHMTAAHINHGLRGSDADSDEKFVINWCSKNDVELKVLHADIRSIAAEKSQGLEECGRNVRYSFFRSLCDDNTKIATAHTLSDSVETVLLNLTKGAGAHGLCGIPPVRDQIIRPLIEITREEVEYYCNYYNLNYVTDSTNFTEEYERNKIRLNIIPQLREINPSFEYSVLSMTKCLNEDDRCLNEIAEEQLQKASCKNGYNLSILNKMPDAVLNRAIIIAVNKIKKVRLENVHVKSTADIVRAECGSVTVAGGIQCTAQGNTLFINKNENKYNIEWSIPFSTPKSYLPDGREIVIQKLTKKEYENRLKFNNLLFNNSVNYDTISSITSVRNRRRGDIFHPARRGVTKSLKKLFNEAKIPPLLRNSAAILESNGELLWIEGFGPSQHACVTNETNNIAQIIIKEF